MKYIALLRGINVGGNHKVEMKKLKAVFESLGCTEVSTYINSGNVIFNSSEKRERLEKTIASIFLATWNFPIPTLIKTKQQIQTIAQAIPDDWVNGDTQKTDVAYFFPDIDTNNILDNLPVQREFIDFRYTKGALIWNIKRENYNRSQVNKLISHKLYQSMTLRNVNTARHLATS